MQEQFSRDMSVNELTSIVSELNAFDDISKSYGISKEEVYFTKQTLGDIMKWEDILKISNERARLLAHEYARADYDAGKEENAERLSKPLVEEVDKFSDIIREYMADTKGAKKI